MLYKSKEEILKLGEIDPELDAVCYYEVLFITP
jgi:hypothetical protein